MKLKMKNIGDISKIKRWSFENINKIDKMLARMQKTRRERRHKLPMSGINRGNKYRFSRH